MEELAFVLAIALVFFSEDISIFLRSFNKDSQKKDRKGP